MSKSFKDGCGFSFSTATMQLPLMVRDGGCNSAGERIRTPEDILRVCEDLRDVAQECFQVLLLNEKNRVIDRTLITLGLANATLVHPREVFRTAVVRSASALVLVHNHPSGDTGPSVEDIRITKQLIDAGKILDIGVLDHCIIGRDSGTGAAAVLSMRESGLCQF